MSPQMLSECHILGVTVAHQRSWCTLQAGEPLVPTPAPLLDAMRALRLRYFTPAEIAALHGFPPNFRCGV